MSLDAWFNPEFWQFVDDAEAAERKDDVNVGGEGR